MEKIAPVLIYPVVGILVIGLGMTFIVEPVMGGINTGLNSFLAGMGSTSRGSSWIHTCGHDGN